MRGQRFASFHSTYSCSSPRTQSVRRPTLSHEPPPQTAVGCVSVRVRLALSALRGRVADGCCRPLRVPSLLSLSPPASLSCTLVAFLSRPCKPHRLAKGRRTCRDYKGRRGVLSFRPGATKAQEHRRSSPTGRPFSPLFLSLSLYQPLSDAYSSARPRAPLLRPRLHILQPEVLPAMTVTLELPHSIDLDREPPPRHGSQPSRARALQPSSHSG